MIYQASELLAKLRLLSIWGQDNDGEIEWFGPDTKWRELPLEEESILRDHELNQNFNE